MHSAHTAKRDSSIARRDFGEIFGKFGAPTIMSQLILGKFLGGQRKAEGSELVLLSERAQHSVVTQRCVIT